MGSSQIEVEQNQGTPPKLSRIDYALLNGKLTNLTPGAATADTGTSANADVDTVSFQVFHDKLASYGTWVDHPRWGRAWRPQQPSRFPALHERPLGGRSRHRHDLGVGRPLGRRSHPLRTLGL